MHVVECNESDFLLKSKLQQIHTKAKDISPYMYKSFPNGLYVMGQRVYGINVWNKSISVFTRSCISIHENLDIFNNTRIVTLLHDMTRDIYHGHLVHMCDAHET